MHNFSNSIVGPGPGAMLIYKFDCSTILHMMHEEGEREEGKDPKKDKEDGQGRDLLRNKQGAEISVDVKQADVRVGQRGLQS